MTSFLANCPQCGAMIAKGSACPSCHYSPNAPPVEEQQSLAEEFTRRKDIHTKNYTIYMVLMLGLGFVGLLSAIMWFLVIFRGHVWAFFMAMFLAVVGAVLGYVIKTSQKFFPTEFTCPACNVRLDEMPLNDGHCPGCSVKLR